MSFKVVLASFLPQNDIKKNLKRVEKLVAIAYKNKCNFICFPECAITGLPTEDYKHDIKLGTEIPGYTTNKIAGWARRYNIYIAIGLLGRQNKKLFDTAVLFDNTGNILLKYRRINPQWHSKYVSKQYYSEGRLFKTCNLEFGKFGFAICGDIFDDRVINHIKKSKIDYLLVPMSRSFGEGCLDRNEWHKKEKYFYAQQIKKIGVNAFLVNAYEPGNDGSFGGALIISKEGKIVAESDVGLDSILIYRFY